MKLAKLALFLSVSIILRLFCLSKPVLIISGILLLIMKAVQLRPSAHSIPSYPFVRRHREPYSHAASLEQALPLCDVELGISPYKGPSQGSNEQVECVFCLFNIEEGEEIRELRCRHLFHRSCLDRWLKYRPSTCPLCRNSLISHETEAKLPDRDEEELDDTAMVLVAYVSVWMVIVVSSLRCDDC